MRKILFLLILMLFQNVFALDELKDVGIAKYAVLEVIQDNTPLREKADENAKRVTHLFKGSVLFADKENKNYFRVELKDNKYFWVNKKYVEVQAIIPEKRIDNVQKISFKEEKNKYRINIDTDFKSTYIIKEGNNNLDFTLYDNYFDPVSTKVIKQNDKFELPQMFTNDLNLKYTNNKPLFGYDVESYDKGYILTVKKSPKINYNKPLKNIKVTLDAGHGGDEKGACAFGLEEKTINLQIVKKLRKEFKKQGAKVYLTRKKDKKTDLYERISFAKEKDSDILLSIHQNSLPNPKYVDKKHGVGTYYYHPQAYPLAQKIQENLLEATKFKDDKVNYASFAITRATLPVSVLIECGYIIKQDEAEKISDKKFQKIIAKAITKGCAQYLKERF